MLETIKKYNSHIKRFIFASSAAVYGDLPDLPKSDQSLILPLSPYAIDKYYGERTTLNYCSLYNIPTAVVKFFNVFGPRQDPKSQYSGVISKCSIHLNITSLLHFWRWSANERLCLCL